MTDDYRELVRPLLGVEDSVVKEPSPRFTSVTRRFLSSTNSRELKCPRCGNFLNFPSGVEWVGPDSFTCNVCNRLLSISLIHRALRDIGIEQKKD